MLNSPKIADHVLKGEIHHLKETMAKSKEMGMCTFDQALFDLHEAGEISYDDALRNADSTGELKLAIKLKGKQKPKGEGAGQESGSEISFSIKERDEPEEITGTATFKNSNTPKKAAGAAG